MMATPQPSSDFTLLDILDLVMIFLQLKTHVKLNRQATNNDLIKELHKDTDEIISRLESFESRLDGKTKEKRENG